MLGAFELRDRLSFGPYEPGHKLTTFQTKVNRYAASADQMPYAGKTTEEFKVLHDPFLRMWQWPPMHKPSLNPRPKGHFENLSLNSVLDERDASLHEPRWRTGELGKNRKTGGAGQTSQLMSTVMMSGEGPQQLEETAGSRRNCLGAAEHRGEQARTLLHEAQAKAAAAVARRGAVDSGSPGSGGHVCEDRLARDLVLPQSRISESVRRLSGHAGQQSSDIFFENSGTRGEDDWAYSAALTPAGAAGVAQSKKQPRGMRGTRQSPGDNREGIFRYDLPWKRQGLYNGPVSGGYAPPQSTEVHIHPAGEYIVPKDDAVTHDFHLRPLRRMADESKRVGKLTSGMVPSASAEDSFVDRLPMKAVSSLMQKVASCASSSEDSVGVLTGAGAAAAAMASAGVASDQHTFEAARGRGGTALDVAFGRGKRRLNVPWSQQGFGHE